LIKSTGLKKLKNFINRLDEYFKKGIDKRLNEIGNKNIQRTRMRFDRTKADPTGNAWLPLSPWYHAWKTQYTGSSNQNILILTGKLRNSITKKIGSDMFGKYVEVGTNVKYGVKHQYGAGRIPARPFLGFEEKEVNNALKGIFGDLKKL